ncbi:DUF3592 domain-containing protein [Trueperella bialowiezensis]|uniref:Protein of uncharacterized function (DUF3592) n=1 Tax=Trueperella bialowiezensis TaxID=312285 RepID=A0A3S5EW42_9ACTO|nr:DUF3592 domain-containing protein [Trueperella bialowiezensis]VEI13628.1 Protein of uncharacterised function (DUF3592) [Trueperella bialowiezensis]
MNRRMALAIVGAVLALFGVFAAVLIFTDHRGSGTSFPWGFMAVAGAFVVGGCGLALYNLRANAADSQLVESGIPYWGVVTAIERKVQSAISGKTHYVLTATGTHGSDTRAFTKVYEGVRPFLDEGQEVTIYVDREDPERFVIKR